MRNIRVNSVMLGAIIALAGPSGGACAQVADRSVDTDRAEPAGAPAAQGDIVVTAQKRVERLIDVPVSVTAIDAAGLTRQNLTQLRDYFDRVPGLSYTGGGGFTTVALRGITTGRGANPTVSTTVDDTPFGSSSSAGYGDRLTPDLDPSNLERVEVLRGPQGTLYGANNLGGLIKYVTATPDPSRTRAAFEFGGQSIAHGDTGAFARGSVNLPIVDDRVAIRVNGFYRQDPGFIDNTLSRVRDSNSGRAWGGRIALFARPVDDVTVTLQALSQDLQGTDSPTVFLAADGSSPFGRWAAPLSARPVPYVIRNRLYQGRVAWDIGGVELTSITGYGESRYNTPTDSTDRFAGVLTRFGYPGRRAILRNTINTDKVTQEVRLSSRPGGTIEWLVGGFYTNEDTVALQSLDAIAGADSANLYAGNIPSTFRDLAAFGTLTWHFTPTFDVQFGGRLASNRQVYRQALSGPLNGGSTANVQRFRETAATWLVSPRWRIGQDLTAYARVASGYRPGGPNTNLPSLPPSYASDRTTNYELGLKGLTPDRRIGFDVSVFWIDWTNIQLSGNDPTSGYLFYTNGSRARSRGAEANVDLHPWAGGTVVLTGAYTDAALTRDLPRGATAALFGNAGSRLPYSARWAGTVSADQDIALTGDVTGFVGGTAVYNGRRVAEFQGRAGVPRVTLPAYATLDLRAGMRSGPLAFTLFARNVTDQRGQLGGTYRVTATPASGTAISVIDPRTIGLSVGYSY